MAGSIVCSQFVWSMPNSFFFDTEDHSTLPSHLLTHRLLKVELMRNLKRFIFGHVTIYYYFCARNLLLTKNNQEMKKIANLCAWTALVLLAGVG